MEEFVKVTGVFKKAIYERANGYKVFSFAIAHQEHPKEPIKTNHFGTISVVFNKLDVEVDKYYDLVLEYQEASRYPNSYNLISLNESEYWKLNYIVKFLQSPHFPGIGPITAKKIVDKFGFDTIKILTDDSSLNFLEFGMKKEAFEQMQTYLRENKQAVEDQIFFLKLNLSPDFYEKVNQKFLTLESFINTYRDNFYEFYFDQQGLKISDLAKINKFFHPEGHEFDKAMIIYQALENFFFDSGNTKTQISTFYSYFFKNIERVTVEEFKNNLKPLIVANKVLLFDNKSSITTSKLREMEEYIVERMHRVQNGRNSLRDIKFEDNQFDYDSLQIEAINSALNEKMVLITGSPGTGKTLITNRIIEELLKYYPEDRMAIVTPTGRATININKLSSKKAVTIHSFLQWDPDKNIFKINESWPESIECLIIDEFSMVSVDLFFNLLKGISTRTLAKIILVGDKNQLPSIGPGYLIHDFIEANIFKTIELTKIYRQSENYEIIQDAIDINEGRAPSFLGKNSQFRETKKEELAKKITEEISELLKQGYSKRDIAILSPIYNYQTGIDYLNDSLAKFWKKLENSEQNQISKTRKICLDDKVLNTVNDPSKKVFNGEIGYVSKFTFDKENSNIITHVAVDFEDDEKTVVYTKSEFLKKTIPAYCTSVHKYQGSECKVVLTVLFSEAKRLLSKKLIYTAITRSKRLSIVFGEKEALEFGVKNDNDSHRQTCIKELWKAITE
ncbi:exodeoxyribonuclease V C-terminal fragment [Metamycoplasma arthritidis]|uniref:Exodeoxyribonuclease V, alpha subunit n=1 Tax=Metamycoplasma arthritidis (strain 158L3-1) TaxID=243272 RepID=B3PNH0_META1|nr:AAA family ATPase [Metamycoplasma arthritidis]ACF07572.1 exodeoxyribonuclease V, alpha subunit [Metamycoplasma arthritidis 158L3-1]VEU79080.1 exodeoxyribonuclease V C-terminal fragment [Metamycoplasma arthritidis]